MARSAVVRSLVLPISQGSELEESLAWTMRAAKVAPFEREYRFHPTRQWRFDFAWVELLVAAECEGSTKAGFKGRHTSPKGFEEDCVKYDTAATMGWRVLRFTRDMIEDGRALDLIEAALAWSAEEQLAA